MPLFVASVTDDKTLPEYGESEFAYLDRTTRKPLLTVKAWLEDEFIALKAASRSLHEDTDFMRRFSDINDVNFYGAFLELYTHAILRRLFPSTSLRNSVPEPRRDVDIACQDLQGHRILFECTNNFGSLVTDKARNTADKSVLDMVNKLQIKDFYVSVYFVDGSSHAYDLKSIKSLLLLKLEEAKTNNQSTEASYEKDDVEINFRIFRKSPSTRSRKNAATVGAIIYRGGFLNGSGVLKSLYAKRAGRYGIKDESYIIVVNDIDTHTHTEAVMDALYGEETVFVSATDHQPSFGRVGGFFRASGGNPRVSAVLSFRSVHPVSILDPRTAPTLWLNPSAQNQLDVSAFPFEIKAIDKTTGELITTPATKDMSEILNLPSDWPSMDQDDAE